MSKFRHILHSSLFRTIAPLALSVFAPGLGSALGASLGIGSTAGSALLGAGTGLLSGGGLRGALLGGISGGLGANIGNFADAPLGAGVQGAVRSGSGLLGGLGDAFGINSGSSIGRGLTSALSGGSSSSYGGGNPVSSLLSAGFGSSANDQAERQLLEQQRRNQALYQPFLNAQFTPGDLTQDPGYQFRLQQGNQNLGRTQSARGNYFSGQALQEAQGFGQGLADQTYNDAYNRFLQQNSANLGAAQLAAGVNTNIGNIQGNTTRANSDLLTQAGSNLFGGGGFNSSGSPFNQNQLAGLSEQERQRLLQLLGVSGGGGASAYAGG